MNFLGFARYFIVDPQGNGELGVESHEMPVDLGFLNLLPASLMAESFMSAFAPICGEKRLIADSKAAISNFHPNVLIHSSRWPWKS